MAIEQLDLLRNAFKAAIDKDVGSLIQLHEDNARTPGRPPDWQKTIKRSSIVLIAASLENYIEELVCSGLSYLSQRKVRANKYPAAFRIWRFRTSAHERSLSVDDAKDLIDLSLKLYSEIAELNVNELNIEEIKNRFSNPTSKNVNWIMGLLGRNNYVNNIHVTVNGFAINVKSGLDELAQRRNMIAHGEVGQNPNINDVIRLHKFACAFSTRIKRDVTNTIESCI